MADQTRTDNRVSITIQLTPGKDDDLIAYLRSFGKGQRQQEIKAALRHWSQRETDNQAEKLAQLESQNFAIYEAIQELSKKIESGVRVNGSTPIDPVNRLSDEQKARRASKMDKAEW